MNKTRAIKKNCLDCYGGSPLDVTLCVIIDCPLWEHRLGCSPRSREYQERVTKAIKAHPRIVEEIVGAGVDMAYFSCKHPKKGLPGKNKPRVRGEAGGDTNDDENGNNGRNGSLS